MVDRHRTESAEEDPRRAIARRRLEAAQAALAAKDADKQRNQRRLAPRRGHGPAPPGLTFSCTPTVYVHAILLAIAVTLAALALVACYVLLNRVFVAGRVIGLPAGILATLALSYASGCYLGIVESSSHGHTTLDDALQGDYRDWFWTLPATFGMAALAGVVGWGLSLPGGGSPWMFIGVSTFMLAPLLQLSSLETGSPLAPVSLPVLQSLVTRPLAWLAFYGASALIIFPIVALAKFAWRDPPFVTMTIMGPIATVGLLIYGWMLGQLARWIGADRSVTDED